MKKHVVVISSVLQFVAAVMFFATIKGAVMLSNGGIGLGTVFIMGLVAVAAQILCIKLKQKYSEEVKKAEEIMQKPKTSYGWIALNFFMVVVIFVLIYAKFILK